MASLDVRGLPEVRVLAQAASELIADIRRRAEGKVLIDVAEVSVPAADRLRRALAEVLDDED